MADPDWLNKAVKNPAVRQWFNNLQSRYPDDIKGNVKDYIKNDMDPNNPHSSGYNYQAAVTHGMYPRRDEVSGDLHWDDIGKNPDYWAKYMARTLTPAIRQQEGSPVNNPDNQVDTRTKTISTSVNNNVGRWLDKYPNAMNGQGPDFVSFMGNQGGPYGHGWAPVGAANDPHNLNANWIPGVKEILQGQLGQGQYDYLHSKNLVLNDQSQGQA